MVSLHLFLIIKMVVKLFYKQWAKRQEKLVGAIAVFLDQAKGSPPATTRLHMALFYYLVLMPFEKVS